MALDANSKKAHCAKHDDEHEVDYKTILSIVSLQHECQLKEIELQKTNEEIQKLQMELEKLKLEKKWCFDEEGNRIHPSAEQIAWKISQQLVEHPEHAQDVVKRLRMIRIDLQCSYNDLKQRCESLKEVLK